jgi:hypothetical protein
VVSRQNGEGRVKVGSFFLLIATALGIFRKSESETMLPKLVEFGKNECEGFESAGALCQHEWNGLFVVVRSGIKPGALKLAEHAEMRTRNKAD